MKQRDPKPAAARPRAARRGGQVAAPSAAADIDRVVEQYCNLIIEKGPNDPEYWFWPRAAWADDGQLIVDGENGSLYRVEFTTNAQQEATFAEPVEVLETFTDLAPSAKAAVLSAAREGTKNPAQVRVFASRSDLPARLPTPPKAGAGEGVGDAANNVGMNRDQLCEALGLPTTATDSEIDAATAARKAELDAANTGAGEGEGTEGTTPAAPAEGTPAPAEGTPAPETGNEGTPAPAEGTTPPAPAASAGPREGMVEVPAETWQQVQQGAAAGAQVAQDAERQRRDDTISTATGKGKISPAAKQSMENLHERDPEAFYKLLTASVADGGLQEGLIPVSQRGSTGGGEVAASSAEVTPARMAALFPEVAIPGGNS